ncbi:MAG: response regulator transcription factor [Flavobacteriales bacterium]|nr:response regulator transcription factor [Flavobacteriales bacterium]
MNHNNINILVIDDHKIFGEGLCSLLENNDYRVSNVIQDPRVALTNIKNNQNINLIFCDVNMPKIDGIELIKKIKNINSNIRIIMVSMYTDKNIINKALKNGADGYLSKNSSIEDFTNTISNLFSSKKNQIPKFSEQENIKDDFSLKYKLTDREKEIIKQILEQKSNVEIGESLLISKRTVETHRKNIMLKLDVKNSIGIVVKTLENNLLNLDT